MNKLLTTSFAAMLATLTSTMPLQAAYDECCPSDCYTCYDTCCERFWGSAEYLYWKIQDIPQPVPLVIESQNPDALLNDPDTQVVLGGKKVKNDWNSGGRFALGYWFDDCRTFGAEVSYFILPSQSRKHSVSNPGTDGSGYLNTPFYDITTDSEAISGVAGYYDDTLGPYSGNATLRLSNSLQGAELNAIMDIPTCDCNFKVGLLGGFRWLNYDETLTFVSNSPLQNYPGDVFDNKDKFETLNNFYGGQIGVSLDYSCGCFFANVKGKLALGANCANNKISGSFSTNEFVDTFPPVLGDTVTTYEGGFFAQGTNIGNHKKTNFAFIPEFNLNLGYKITECLNIKAGYTFLYVNKVLRAGNQIDRNLNLTQSYSWEGPNAVLVGDPSPRALNRTNSIWAQGLSVGFDLSF